MDNIGTLTQPQSTHLTHVCFSLKWLNISWWWVRTSRYPEAPFPRGAAAAAATQSCSLVVLVPDASSTLSQVTVLNPRRKYRSALHVSIAEILPDCDVRISNIVTRGTNRRKKIS